MKNVRLRDLLVGLVNAEDLTALDTVVNPDGVMARQPIRPRHVTVVNDDRLPRALLGMSGERCPRFLQQLGAAAACYDQAVRLHLVAGDERGCNVNGACGSRGLQSPVVILKGLLQRRAEGQDEWVGWR
jgi:hypothetical protein